MQTANQLTDEMLFYCWVFGEAPHYQGGDQMLGGSPGRGQGLWAPRLPPAICDGDIIGQARSNTTVFS